MPYIDLAFRLIGTSVPVDHGYAVYAAISRIIPEIHDARTIGVQPIRGVYSGNGALHVTKYFFTTRNLLMAAYTAATARSM